MVEAGAVRALIPLLHPRFELIRIEGLVRGREKVPVVVGVLVVEVLTWLDFDLFSS